MLDKVDTFVFFMLSLFTKKTANFFTPFKIDEESTLWIQQQVSV